MTDEKRHPDDHPYADYTAEDPLDSPAGYEFHREPGKFIWRHQETGLTVTVAKHTKPDQMHNPRTSKLMEGYRSEVRGGPDDVAESLCVSDLGNQPGQLEIAAEFMATFPDGEYVPILDYSAKYEARPRWRHVAEEEDR